MNKKSISISDSFFNYKLYIQGMKQLKTVGLVSLICAVIYAVLFSVVMMIDSNSDSYTELLPVNGVFFPLYIILYLIVPLMCITSFSFLTKRNGSDFYHSIPQKRQCVFLSLLSAIVSWAFILIFCFTALFSILLKLMTPTLVLSVPNVLIFAFNIFISCLLMTAVFLLGCSLSGTVNSNIITSLIILIVPRLIMTVICCFISWETSLVNHDSMFILTRDYCNMVTYPVMSYGIFDNYYDPTTYVPFMHLDFSTVYTFILAIIYVFAGSRVYTKRPSEAAGIAYHSKWLRIISRMLIGYIISLLIVYGCLDSSSFDITECFIIFVFAAVTMFVYEIIFTKSLKKGLKTFVSSPLILVIDVITVAVILLTCNRIKSHVPDTEDVDYIYIESMSIHDDYFDYPVVYDIDNPLDPEYGCYSDSEYLSCLTSKVKITDHQIIKEVISSFEQEASGHTNTQYGSYMSVTIDDGLMDITRNICISEALGEKINSDIQEELTAFLIDIPESPDCFNLNCHNLTYEQRWALYDTFSKEYNALSDEEKLDVITGHSNGTNIDCINYFDIDMYVDGHCVNMELPITRLTPDTYSQYLKYSNLSNEKDFLYILDYGIPKNNGCITLNIAELTEDNNMVTVLSYDSRNFFNDFMPFNNDLLDLESILTDFAESQSSYQSSYTAFDNIDTSQYYLCRAELINYNLDYERCNAEYYFLIEKTSGFVESFNKTLDEYHDTYYDEDYNEYYDEYYGDYFYEYYD